MKNQSIPDSFCLAPWIHAMYDTHNVRKLCCISGYDRSNPVYLEEFKNSDFTKNVRKMMVAGQLPKECEYCDSSNSKQKHVKHYKDFFNEKYGEYYEEALLKTQPDGYTTMETKSFDYRFGNVCNYKCRHCSSRSSSKIEHEEKQHGITHAWSGDRVVNNLDLRHETLEKELLMAADAGVLGDIQWIGGEPLFSEAHWRVMTHLSENNDCSDIHLQYITNLSILEFKGKKLIDLIKPFKGVHIHASIESGGTAAEYIRTGLNWQVWKENFRTIKNSFTRSDFKIAAGITLSTFSLPGLREYLEFLCDENTHLAGATIHKPNPNNYHLDIDSLGSYKAQWLQEYRELIEEYKPRLLAIGDYDDYSYSQLVEAADILERQTSLDLDNLSDKERNQLKRSVAWANKTDSIRPAPHSADVIKDYPFLTEWWYKINSL